MLKLNTKDGKEVEVTQDIREMCGTIDKALLDNEEEVVTIDYPIMEKDINLIKEFCAHHEFKKKETDLEQTNLSRDPKEFIKDEWDREFMEKLDLDSRFSLLQAANTLDCKALYALCCACAAAAFKGKSFNEIRDVFGMKDLTFTPEDEKSLSEEHPWFKKSLEEKMNKIAADQV